MKRICFIAQFPPPIHGLSKAVETLYNSQLQSKYTFQQINITNNKKILHTLWQILTLKSDLYYFTISQTKGGNWRDLIILKLLQWKGSKCLIHLHGGYYRTLIEKDCGKFQRKLNYNAMKHIAGAIVLGNSLEYIFKEIVPQEKIAVVPNCVDEQFMLSSESCQIKCNQIKTRSTLHILYLSNFIEAKGYKEVLELAQRAKREQNHTLHFHFAGKFFEEKDKIYFNNFINNYQLNDFVSYHGIVSGEEKRNLLKLCNIFILLTRYPNEGQPISILEAMGNAMTIITTNHAGIPDIIEQGRNGFITDKRTINIEQIYDYILQLNNQRNKLAEIGQRNFDQVKSTYTEQQYIDNMDNVFQKVLKS